MAVVSIKAHVGSWTGPEMILKLAQVELSDSDPVPEAGTYKTMDTWASTYPGVYSLGYTWFYKNSTTYNNAIASGVPAENLFDVSQYTDSNPLVLYVSETKTITIKSGPSFQFSESGAPGYSQGIWEGPLALGYPYSGSIRNVEVFAWSSGYTARMRGIGTGSTSLFDFWDGISPYNPPADPYAPGGESEPGGGDGTFDFSSDPVDFQDAPTIGAYDTGMISIYVPTAANLQSLAAYLWAGAFDPNNFRKLVADPMDAIIGLSILPVKDTEIGTTSSTLAVGNISTGLSMPRANKQYVVIDCGTVNILPKWGAYIDFSPYSKLQLFLPYIGYVDISPDDCMNTTIAVKYTIDILSGTCVAQVKCDDHVLYEFSGTCSCSCPVTAGQYQNIALGALRMGGALASMATAAVTGNLGGALAGIGEAASTVQDSVKPAISRSGGFGGSSGLMGHQYPYLILTVPRLCTPGQQDMMMGYPSFVTQDLADLSGYASVNIIHLHGIPATEAEEAEIKTLLQEGVYF